MAVDVQILVSYKLAVDARTRVMRLQSDSRSQGWIYNQPSVKTQTQSLTLHRHPVYKRVAQLCAPGFFRWGLSLGTTSAPHKAVRGLRASPAEQKALHLAIGSPPSMAVSESVQGGPAPCAFRGWSRVGVHAAANSPSKT